jgi:predicted transcriptional regulator
MLIQRKPIAVKVLSVRTDLEAFERIQALAESLDISPSVLLRLAISDLLCKQARVGAKNLSELMTEI